MIYITPIKVGSVVLSLPTDSSYYINRIRQDEREIEVSTLHPIVPETKILRGLIKPTQN